MSFLLLFLRLLLLLLSRTNGETWEPRLRSFFRVLPEKKERQRGSSTKSRMESRFVFHSIPVGRHLISSLG